MISSISKISTNLAYQAGIGMSYKLSERIFIDATYHLVHMPHFNLDTTRDMVRYNRTSADGVSPITGSFIGYPRSQSLASIRTYDTQGRHSWHNSLGFGIRAAF